MTTVAGGGWESVFKLPLAVPADQAAWSNSRLLAAGPQPFARFGLETDGALRPVDAQGRPVLTNVHFAGPNLAGFDGAFEKSGNGVAVVTGYHAGTAAGRSGDE